MLQLRRNEKHEVKHCAALDVKAEVVPMLMKIALVIDKINQQIAHENAIT